MVLMNPERMSEMNKLAKALFVRGTLLTALPLRLAQYYLNKDAFDKAASVPGIYELADLPYKKGQKKPRKYRPVKAAMGKKREHLLDIESPEPLDKKLPKKLPVIVSVHGGGYLTNNKECNRPHCQYFASKGYKVVNVNYTLQPEAELPEEIQELADVFAWIGDNAGKYGFDKKNIFLTGDSSGGHLVLLYTAVQNNKDLQKKLGVTVKGPGVRATAATCPVGSFVAKDLVSTVFRNLAGRLYDDEMKLALSYEGFADETYPEVCIVTTDTDVPIHTTTEGIHKYLDQKGLPHWYKSFDGRTHKLGHVFNGLHPYWEESLEANQFILDFFESKKE